MVRERDDDLGEPFFTAPVAQGLFYIKVKEEREREILPSLQVSSLLVNRLIENLAFKQMGFIYSTCEGGTACFTSCK